MARMSALLAALETPQSILPPACSRWPPGHSGRILGFTCRLEGAAGGFGHTGVEFGWLSAQTRRPSAQQLSGGMRRIDRGGLAGIRQNITQGLGARIQSVKVTESNRRKSELKEGT
eukprot:scaffold176658_cov23-Tisochrysis_lutea.AAC.1